MSSHTPGPWNAVKSQPRIYWIDAHEQPCAYGHIATVFEGGKDPDENAANARLIAAAPDLLAALEDMLSGWRYIRETHGDLYGVGWDRAENAARAAIAKARGK